MESHSEIHQKMSQASEIKIRELNLFSEQDLNKMPSVIIQSPNSKEEKDKHQNLRSVLEESCIFHAFDVNPVVFSPKQKFMEETLQRQNSNIFSSQLDEMILSSMDLEYSIPTPIQSKNIIDSGSYPTIPEFDVTANTLERISKT
jgi:hypothetical protein